MFCRSDRRLDAIALVLILNRASKLFISMIELVTKEDLFEDEAEDETSEAEDEEDEDNGLLLVFLLDTAVTGPQPTELLASRSMLSMYAMESLTRLLMRFIGLRESFVGLWLAILLVCEFIWFKLASNRLTKFSRISFDLESVSDELLMLFWLGRSDKHLFVQYLFIKSSCLFVKQTVSLIFCLAKLASSSL